MLDILIYILFSLFIAIFFFIAGVLTEHEHFYNRLDRSLDEISRVIVYNSRSAEWCFGALHVLESMMNKEEKK